MNEWRFFVQMVGREVGVKFFFVQMEGTNPGKCEWVWEEKLRWLNPRWPNSRWQNSRWLPSTSWVRMNKFESDYISLSQSEWSESVFEWIWEKKTRCLNPTWQNSRWLPSSSWVRMNEWRFLIQHGRIQDGCHHQVESEWMSEVFFVQMVGREVWVKFFLCTGGIQSCQVWVSLRGKTKVAESKMAKFKMAAIIKLSENEWVWVRLNKFEPEFCAKWLNPRWQKSRWEPSSS